MILDMWFKNLSQAVFPLLFFDGIDETEIRSLAFVVDDTESMKDEISVVKELIKAIVKAEKYLPFYYILSTFNDSGNDINLNNY